MSEIKTIGDFDHIETADGTTVCISNIKNKGMRLTVYGWRRDRSKFKEGDTLLLRTDETVNDGSPYRITKVDLPRDPDDQYFLRCEYMKELAP